MDFISPILPLSAPLPCADFSKEHKRADVHFFLQLYEHQALQFILLSPSTQLLLITGGHSLAKTISIPRVFSQLSSGLDLSFSSPFWSWLIS